VLFVIYVLSISYGIYKGAMSAPEDSDSDSDSDSDDEEEKADDLDTDSDDDNPRRSFHKHTSKQDGRSAPRSPVLRYPSPDRHSSDDEESGASTVTLLNEHHPLTFSTHKKPQKPHVINKRPKSMCHHILQLILGFLALSV